MSRTMQQKQSRNNETSSKYFLNDVSKSLYWLHRKLIIFKIRTDQQQSTWTCVQRWMCFLLWSQNSEERHQISSLQHFFSGYDDDCFFQMIKIQSRTHHNVLNVLFQKSMSVEGWYGEWCTYFELIVYVFDIFISDETDSNFRASRRSWPRTFENTNYTMIFILHFMRRQYYHECNIFMMDIFHQNNKNMMKMSSMSFCIGKHVIQWSVFDGSITNRLLHFMHNCFAIFLEIIGKVNFWLLLFIMRDLFRPVISASKKIMIIRDEIFDYDLQKYFLQHYTFKYVQIRIDGQYCSVEKSLRYKFEKSYIHWWMILESCCFFC